MVLLVDADNAFNRLNRKAAIYNIRELCLPFHQYLKNTYQKSVKLIVNELNDSYSCDFIYSDEGATQGVVAAIAEYDIGIYLFFEKKSIYNLIYRNKLRK